MSDEYHTYTATHKGWFLLCPVLLADVEEDAIVPINRGVPSWWLEFNLWLNDNVVQQLIAMFASESVGYMFYAVEELPEPRKVMVKAMEEG